VSDKQKMKLMRRALRSAFGGLYRQVFYRNSAAFDREVARRYEEMKQDAAGVKLN